MRIYTLLFLSLISFGSLAQPYGGERANNDVESRAAGCAPATGSTFLEFNNVKALIHTGGNLWQITGQNFSQYEVPKGSGIMALFTSALWLGGIDINGQLKIAAVRYRQGQDYWTGPLTDGGDAEIIPATCVEYDRHFVITQDEVRLFNAWFQAGIDDAENGTNIQATEFGDYEIPASILNWPAHGDESLGQNYYLAPFYDRDGDGNYDPQNGDYPWYDIEKTLDCKVDRTVTLYGDQTVWWVMNDKGNIHTETGADPLGMEIRCQAFAFATNDEINNMTFYNYELVNRSTQTLYNTYFGVFIDGALGGPNDDYVGCDVSRGLGYTYNGNDFDATDGGYLGYGDNPPAAGVDFFEGPYQDNDFVDNPLIEDYAIAEAERGIPYSGLGIGYGDGIIDNERLGMRRFLYYNNLGGGGLAAQTDPQTGQDYYNYLSGFWKDGTRFVYGGSGHVGDPDANPLVVSDYMFPDDTDPVGWGTEGNPQPSWTEQTAGNVPFDRRFAQSSGPFILQPGAVNNITTGIVWARAVSGDPFQSVIALQKADDKAQALFDNCFKVLDGPHAPLMSVQELENQLIFSIYNPKGSNNELEDYVELDPFIVNVDDDPDFDPYYRFQGYQVFQIVDPSVSATDLYDLSKARLVFQTDIKDDISRLNNYIFDETIEATVPQTMVDGENLGIRHSFSVQEDLFASGDRRLVNFKTYHYMVIAYASNQFKLYDPSAPDALDGQKKPYFASRKASVGEVISYSAIPHSPNPENGGTISAVGYGYEIPLTKIDGWGNAGRWTEITESTEDAILANTSVDEIDYKAGASPVEVKVIDPLNVSAADFELYFVREEGDDGDDLQSATWYLVNSENSDTIYADKNINVFNEQLVPEWGISIILNQTDYLNKNLGYAKYETDPIGARLNFKDSSLAWLSGYEDSDGFEAANWIRSGTFDINEDECLGLNIFNPCFYADKGIDREEKFENLLNGIVAPFNLVGSEFIGMPIGYPDVTYNEETTSPNSWYNPKTSQLKVSLADIHGVDIVFTPNKQQWTRCPVIETSHIKSQAIGNSSIMKLRKSKSIDKEGNQLETEGMSWFPGYAIDIETGQRLNMAFGENSWLNGSNGTDMKWNPTDETQNDLGGDPIIGGGHFIYVFGVDIDGGDMPAYDEGNWLYERLKEETNANYINTWKNCMWVMEPLLERGSDLLSTEARMQLRVSHPYQQKTFTGLNNGLPAYRFSTRPLATTTRVNEVAISALDQIRVVPNPYYAYSEYESNNLDNRVKITNLPEKCTITIFNMRGGVVKTLRKDNPLTYIDWTLKNNAEVPIASGVYLVHVDVPGVGEKILKWYGAMRTVDTSNF
jgi:hypothetical protein